MIGASDSEGRIVVGEGQPSRSKYSCTRFVFRDMETGLDSLVLAHDVCWMTYHYTDDENTQQAGERTACLLRSALRRVLNSKLTCPFDRGSPALQCVTGSKPYLYIMEAGARGGIWPRYKWVLPYSMSYVDAVRWAILAETQSPNTLIAEPDRREVKLLDMDPDLHSR